MLKTLKNLAGYYKPYKGLFFSDMFFAILGGGHYSGDSAHCTVYYQ